MPNIKSINCLGKKEAGSVDFVLEPKPDCDIRAAVSERLAERKKTILSLHSNEMTLEQIFLRLTDDTNRDVYLSNRTAEIDRQKPQIKLDLETGEAVIGEQTETEKEYEKEDE